MNEFQLKCIQKYKEKAQKHEAEYKAYKENEQEMAFEQFKSEFPTVESLGNDKFTLFGDVYGYRTRGHIFSNNLKVIPLYELYDLNHHWLYFSNQESYGRYLKDREISIPKPPPIHCFEEGSENFIIKFLRKLLT